MVIPNLGTKDRYLEMTARAKWADQCIAWIKANHEVIPVAPVPVAPVQEVDDDNEEKGDEEDVENENEEDDDNSEEEADEEDENDEDDNSEEDEEEDEDNDDDDNENDDDVEEEDDDGEEDARGRRRRTRSKMNYYQLHEYFSSNISVVTYSTRDGFSENATGVLSLKDVKNYNNSQLLARATQQLHYYDK